MKLLRKTRQMNLLTSLPSRERGLKYSYFCKKHGRMSSLPSRERGLKSYRFDEAKAEDMSLPSRERGLKLHSHSFMPSHRLSLPSRERGLKWYMETEFGLIRSVAPFAGAWIEIQKQIKGRKPLICRSLRGSVD